MPLGQVRLTAIEGSLAHKRVALQDVAVQRVLQGLPWMRWTRQFLPYDVESLVRDVDLRHDAEASHPLHARLDVANDNVADLWRLPRWLSVE